MTFSALTKEELINHYTKHEHCRQAEIASLMLLDGKNVTFDKATGTYIYNFTSNKKTFNIKREIDPATLLLPILENSCCQRAFLRGAFLASGTISNPEKSYHFEIAAPDINGASYIKKVMEKFGLSPKLTTRRGKQVVYLKDAVDISDMLSVMEASKAMMEFENIRIVREMRGSVNRQVNCETANINKTIAASMKQLEDIRLIMDKKGLDALDENLKAVAKARLENPDISLEELGAAMKPPLGKSGVNHRMRKISQIASQLKTK